MPEKSDPDRLNDLHHERFTQIDESHCGPAVIQMLLHNLGVEVAQKLVVEAGGASDWIEQNGMRVDQLSRAVRRIDPHVCFWYKDHSKMKELVQIVSTYNYPVGVEWQGFFEDTLEDETQDGDYGHYSVVTQADKKSRKLVIVDPYKDFRSQDRIFSFEFFASRWWDINDYPDPITGKEHLVKDSQMMFVITPDEETFPQLLGMKCDWQGSHASLSKE
jgi:hypothetical protein